MPKLVLKNGKEKPISEANYYKLEKMIWIGDPDPRLKQVKLLDGSDIKIKTKEPAPKVKTWDEFKAAVQQQNWYKKGRP